MALAAVNENHHTEFFLSVYKRFIPGLPSTQPALPAQEKRFVDTGHNFLFPEYCQIPIELKGF